MNRPSRIYATIDLDAVTWNLENMKKNISKDTKIIAVLKADAYGHGAVPIAQHIESLSYIWGIAVAVWKKGWNFVRQELKNQFLFWVTLLQRIIRRLLSMI